MDIPVEDIQTLVFFASLGGENRNIIVETIESFKKEETFRDVAKRIAEKLNVDNGLAEQLMSIFMSLVRTREAYFEQNQQDVFINSIIEDIDEEYLSDVEQPAFKDFLTAIFDVKNKVPLIHALGYYLSSQNHNVYIASTIYNNLRPVILNGTVEGMVFYHTLKLHIKNDDNSHTDMFFVMDSDDINEMFDQLNEAKSRIDSVKKKYGNDIIPI